MVQRPARPRVVARKIDRARLERLYRIGISAVAGLNARVVTTRTPAR